MSNSLRISPLLIAVLVMLAMLAYLNWPQETQQQQRRGGETPVTVALVAEQPFEIVVEALGTGKANESVVLTAQNTETVQHIYFDDGDTVTAGQLLLDLTNREEKARVHELEVNLAEAKRQLQRIKNLVNTNVASEQLLDEQDATVQALEAQLDVANAQLSELQVRAPFAGQLGIRQVSVGALIRPGDAITTLDDLSIMNVDFSIAENHLASVARGQQVAAYSVAYPGQAFTGKISSIGSRLDPQTRSIQVRAEIANPDLKLRPGMLLQINLQKEVLNTLVVPEKALVPIEDKQYVFVIEDNKAKMVEVRTGERKPGSVQIIDGLTAGQLVVTEGTLRLSNGSAVRILNPEVRA
ncbi:efflux RND transporter periplasmic adaptor subunit [Aestuariibacter salexigens]|uniref:efflux RND transporter periplasmic adaptor subunit n=1 Tax=Aestuariibacter salexigens TaxID=226010 RepID=UPI0003FA34A5|nr:efflux RND transporter periplasmic adaptor subunit [Aestuariibacter salexigens]